MLDSAFGSRRPASEIERRLARLWARPVRRDELVEVIDVLHGGIHRLTPVVDEVTPLPLRLPRDDR